MNPNEPLPRGLIVGLTGGIACGKTTVAELLAQHGADVIGLDEIGHQLLKKGNPVFDQIVKTFGEEILDEFGDISREKLGRIVFHDSERRLRLNQITHPAIIEQSLAEAKRLAALGIERVVIIDSPLLIEAGMQDIMDIVVVVVSDEKTQLDRVIRRSIEQKKPLSVEEAQARLHSQMPLSEKVKYADFVVENNGGLDELKMKVAELWDNLKNFGSRSKITEKKT
ncbi:dephospho-CoA kinase [Candidatus Poribacteria bacterium]|nr:dephospho-CoA kinase [Candidatus Poribacteria bacterium]